MHLRNIKKGIVTIKKIYTGLYIIILVGSHSDGSHATSPTDPRRYNYKYFASALALAFVGGDVLVSTLVHNVRGNIVH